MILTTCAACAAPLAHDAPRCVRCKTRYCDATCQHDHGIDNLSAAVAMREDVYKRTRQIFGPLHPKTQRRQRSLEVFRAALADVQAGRPAIIQFTSNNI